MNQLVALGVRVKLQFIFHIASLRTAAGTVFQDFIEEQSLFFR